MDKDTQGKTNQIEKILSLIEIVEYLRSPLGCEWDMEQTHQSLRNNLIEETYELLDAIEENSSEKIKEELGDILCRFYITLILLVIILNLIFLNYVNM